MQLVREVYEATAGFPADERFGLTAQMHRAAVSVPSNIAEGAAREGRREFAHFVSTARGSLSELETQASIAADLGYLEPRHRVFATLEKVSQLVAGLHRSLRD
jgi:four helix bundle protein